jgi:hypothetical protein
MIQLEKLSKGALDQLIKAYDDLIFRLGVSGEDVDSDLLKELRERLGETIDYYNNNLDRLSEVMEIDPEDLPF